MPAGRVPAPVVGVTGEAARELLAAKPGTDVAFGRVTAERPPSGEAAGATPRNAAPGEARGGRPALFSSEGPALDGAPKPDLLADGAAVAPLPGGGVGIVAGTAVAAARVAAQAAKLARARPESTAASLRDDLAGAPAARPTRAAPRVPLGPLRLTRRNGTVTGVRFTLGAFDRGDPLGRGARLEPAGRLELVLTGEDGTVARRLTPPGGARDLIPAEYAYTLPRQALEDLPPGTYAFRATARPPRRGPAATKRSPSFTR
jgi:hypothetical protein